VARVSTMGEMATGIAHELNQPLAAMATYSFAARRHLERLSDETPHLQNILEQLESQAIRAGEIVRRMRSFVNKSVSTQTAMSLNSLVNDVVSFVDPDIRHADVLLELDLQDCSSIVSMDEIQIQQVLVNLIRNAIDAMDETPTDQRTVTVSTRACENNMVEISVSDSGKGLDAEDLDRVFEAFYSTKDQGMGMGLAISRSIIEDHGGKLQVEANENGSGVTFQFSLPCGDEHGKPN